jgi:hypothetical protein
MDADFRSRASLIKHGVAFDIAWSLSDAEVAAYCILFGEIEGGKFTWQTLRWEEQRSN